MLENSKQKYLKRDIELLAKGIKKKEKKAKESKLTKSIKTTTLQLNKKTKQT